MATYGDAVELTGFTGIRNRRARSRRPALAFAAAVLVAGLAAIVVDEPVAGSAGVRAQVSLEVPEKTAHMPAE
ncbi:hypothetical protein [Saccharothrix sp.]|uniref:hypothetical protein n=1 Tax=Saccharothrix sp. TaxID=1873460 RepID=UPI002810FD60|nr:hypothetical protein [Saccharothrix sp.]